MKPPFMLICILLFKFLLIYLAAPGIGCGTQDLQSLVVASELLVAICGL